MYHVLALMKILLAKQLLNNKKSSEKNIIYGVFDSVQGLKTPFF